MSEKVTESASESKTSPLRRNIGVGLTRSNLSSAGARTPENRPLKGASLTPAIRLKISGASLPSVTRANSERYQSAYSRLGGIRNSSSTELSTVTAQSGADAAANDHTWSKKNGDDINQSHMPRRGCFSTVLTSQSHGREISSQKPSLSTYSPLTLKTEQEKINFAVNNEDGGSKQVVSQLGTNKAKSLDNVSFIGNTENTVKLVVPAEKSKTGIRVIKGNADVDDSEGIALGKKISKFGVVVADQTTEKASASAVPRTVSKFGRTVSNDNEALAGITHGSEEVLTDHNSCIDLTKSDRNSEVDEQDSVAENKSSFINDVTPKWRSELKGQGTSNSRSEVVKVIRGGSINRNINNLENITPDKSLPDEVKPEIGNIPSPRSDSGYVSPRNDLDDLPTSRSLSTERSIENKALVNTSDKIRSPPSSKKDSNNTFKSESLGNKSEGDTQVNTSLNSGKTVTMDVDNGPPPIARPRTRRRLTKRAVSFKKVEDDEFIGFASLPEQVHRKAVRRGFEFTLMVVGETGLGKSTLINSLFLTDLYKDRKLSIGTIEERIHKTVEIEKRELEIEERGVKLKLTIVDTPGFNDAVNAEESWKSITNFIDKQFESYFKAESGLNRKNIQDTRVHCCLYFISPYGHGLRPADILVMKKLHNKVNIVPLIAKSDMLTKPEVKKMKERILSEIEKHRIQIYQFPDCDSDEDEDFKQQDRELKKSIPFAVVGSNTVVEAGGKKIRGRMYPWGIVEVENPLHCDFIRLRQMLISTHMQDLKDVTCDVHYENYRAEHISEQMSSQQKERGKLKRDSIANLDQAMDTDKLLQEKEAEIKRMQEMLVKMQAQLSNQNSPQRNGRVANV